jgi:hypothetical protein
MNVKPPKNYIVYWASKFNGSNPGYSTPVHQPNMMSFDDESAAIKLQKKLTDLVAERGTYRGRIVLHVSPVQEVKDPEVLAQEKREADIRKDRIEAASKETEHTIIGATVRASHPITALNPEEWFVVAKAARDDISKVIRVCGENTCWFRLDQCDIKKVVK